MFLVTQQKCHHTCGLLWKWISQLNVLYRVKNGIWSGVMETVNTRNGTIWVYCGKTAK
jgi:hypothetical protein